MRRGESFGCGAGLALLVVALVIGVDVGGSGDGVAGSVCMLSSHCGDRCADAVRSGGGEGGGADYIVSHWTARNFVIQAAFVSLATVVATAVDGKPKLIQRAAGQKATSN
jgi:hypothetical protein